jgi:hypothetical protein
MNPLDIIDINTRTKLADTGMKFIKLKKDVEEAKDEKAFDVIVKKVEIISEAYQRNKGQAQKREESQTTG